MTAGSNTPSTWQTEFEDIRCYRDQEINIVLKRLTEDSNFVDVLKKLLSPDSKPDHPDSTQSQSVVTELQALRQISSVESLQSWIANRIFPIIAQSYDSLTVMGSDNINPDEPHIFISNHRDIVMDPLLLNSVLMSMGAATANLAIGDNLLVNTVANDLARLNRCFKVARSIKSPKAILNAMKIQSAYIHHLRFTEKENIWIAQKEGRSKDGSDKTNPALIKMLGLAKDKSVEMGRFLNSLNIVPVCFSYEWDPCDIDKATELEAINESSNYTKDRFDDLNAVNKGLNGHNGRINIRFGNSIRIDDTENGSAHKLVADQIDQVIRENYHLFPVNVAAYKKLNRNLPDCKPFCKQEVNAAQKQLEQRIEGQTEEIKKRVLKAYAAPLEAVAATK